MRPVSNLTFGPFYFEDFIVSDFDADGLIATMLGANGQAYAVIDEAGQLVQDIAKEIVPVDTSRLQQSISRVITEEGDSLVEYIGTDVPYAETVEFGLFNQPQQPYLRPAMDALLSQGWERE